MKSSPFSTSAGIQNLLSVANRRVIQGLRLRIKMGGLAVQILFYRVVKNPFSPPRDEMSDVLLIMVFASGPFKINCKIEMKAEFLSLLRRGFHLDKCFWIFHDS